MSVPQKIGLLDLLRTSMGTQFVIPVYQRNYTWTAEKEVKQYLDDMKSVLEGKYIKHFLGIIIYLEKSISVSEREFSIIDGQQRLTTTFLIIYAVKKMLQSVGDTNKVNQFENQFLTNPYSSDKIKYKLKPLVSDDDVYRSIIDGTVDYDESKDSTVLKNYLYIEKYLGDLLKKNYSIAQIEEALNKLYIVCVPIDQDDNAQKIFESINATGAKLTSADLIRNFMLMNLESDTQDKFYKIYWREIEKNVSQDSKILEMFFRMFLAGKKYELVSKNAVYRSFVDWVTETGIETEDLFKELLNYAKTFNELFYTDIKSLKKEIRVPLTDFRKIDSDVPLSLILELYKKYRENLISADIMGQLLSSVNAFMIRRSFCDMDSQNISKLFPTVLKKLLQQCNGDYSNAVNILNQEMVGNNAGTSGSYMPTDSQMYELLHNASVYKRPALRTILDRLELNDNPAPVDLTKLSIEHLMPQTPTDEWLEELDTDIETYTANLNRLGNLTLAAVSDNSKMSNLLWDFKNEILKGTGHIKMNEELLKVKRWDLEHIETRTVEMIDKICKTFPYPNVVVNKSAGDDSIDEKVARELTVKTILPTAEEIKKNTSYKSDNGACGYIIYASKLYPDATDEKYWFAYRENKFDIFDSNSEQFCIYICRNRTATVLKIPRDFIEEKKQYLNTTLDEDDNVRHYHMHIYITPTGEVKLLLSKPHLNKLDITKYVVAELDKNGNNLR